MLQVFLVNPNGILFGNGASVNVDGLVASTLNIADADFTASCRVPCDHIPRRSWPLFKARAVLAGLLASLSLENKP